MVKRGTNPRLAEMLALQQPPASGRGSKYRGTSDGLEYTAYAEHYRKMAKRSGVSISGKRYDPTLARFPGDPRAWCSNWDDAAKVSKKLRKELASEREPGKYRVADDIVEKHAATEVEGFDELPKEKKLQKLEEVRERITPANLDG